jgi:putative hydrolase of the HAD superfamily
MAPSMSFSAISVDEKSACFVEDFVLQPLNNRPAKLTANKGRENRPMSELFEKSAITSSEFPVLLFDAAGTLFHHHPALKTFYFHAFKKLGFEFTEAEIHRALLGALRRLNKDSRDSDEYEFKPASFVEALIVELKFEASEVADLEKKLLEAFAIGMKIVLPNTVVDSLDELKKRGYRLGIVSNWTFQLGELLRVQGVLDLFDSIVTAHEVGFAKPRREIFEAATEDLDIDPKQCVFVGSSYAADIVGAQRLEMLPVLYDPEHTQLRALEPIDTSGKVVSIEKLRQNRNIQGVKVITKFEELLDFCK